MTIRKSTCTVRITVKLRPSEYDELSRHVREIGSTMSAFFRESVVKGDEGGAPRHGAQLPEELMSGAGDTERERRCWSAEPGGPCRLADACETHGASGASGSSAVERAGTAMEY
jgi:hypothetical protein